MPVVAARAQLGSFVKRTMPFTPTGGQWFAIAYGNGVFVAPGFGSTYAARSTDGGITWAQVTLTATGNWGAVATDGNGTWIAGRDSTTAGAISTDNGATWSALTMPSNGTLRCFAYGNGYFIAAYHNTTSAYRSSNSGTTWSTATLPVSRNWWRPATDGAGTWVIPATSGGAYAALSTDNGASWSNGNFTVGESFGAGYVRDRFVIFTSTANLYYSTSGSSWTAGTTGDGTGGNVTAASAGQGILMAASGNSASFVYASNDGTTYRKVTIPETLSNGPCAYGSGRFVFPVNTAVNYCYTVDTIVPPSLASTTSITRASHY